MSKRRSKLKEMAAAGDAWAIATLAKMQAEGRTAAARGAAMQRAGAAPAKDAAMQRAGAAPAKDAAFEEAMREAKEILTWRLGPNAPGWRVYRLAQALIEHG